MCASDEISTDGNLARTQSGEPTANVTTKIWKNRRLFIGQNQYPDYIFRVSYYLIKLIYTEIGLAEDGTQCTLIQFLMFRYNELCKRSITTQNNMTAL